MAKDVSKGSGHPTGGTGLEPNIASLLCYVPAPITSIIFLILEKENKDVKFHAWQGLLFGGGSIVLLSSLKLFRLIVGLLVSFLGVLTDFLFVVVFIGLFILWVVCLIKAYQGERWKIPVLGDIAAQKAGV